MIKYILNIPYTLIGIIISVLSFPKKIVFLKRPLSLIFYVKNMWWRFGYLKGARAITLGNIVILGPKIEEFDLGHEITHVYQYLKYPLIFPVLYYVELFKNGYKDNKFEKEAFANKNK